MALVSDLVELFWSAYRGRRRSNVSNETRVLPAEEWACV
jgi:hypothetical protein